MSIPCYFTRKTLHDAIYVTLTASTIVQSAHSLYIEILSQGCGGAGVVARVVARRAAREAATVSVARVVATEAAVTEAAATERRRGEGGGE